MPRFLLRPLLARALLLACLLLGGHAAAEPLSEQTRAKLTEQASAWKESVRQVSLAHEAVRAAEGRKPPELGFAAWEQQLRGPFLQAAEKAAADALAREQWLHQDPSLVRAYLERWLVAVQGMRGNWALEVEPHPEHQTELALMRSDSLLETPQQPPAAGESRWKAVRKARAAELGIDDLLVVLTRLDELRDDLGEGRDVAAVLSAAVEGCERAARNEAINFPVRAAAASYLTEPGYWLALAKLRAGDRAAARPLFEKALRESAAASGLFVERYRRALARLDAADGMPAAAHDGWRKILGNLRGRLGNAGIHLDEAGQRAQAFAARPFLDEYLAFLARHPAEQADPEAFTLRQFKGAGFVLQQRSHIERQHPTLAPLFAEWSQLVAGAARISVEAKLDGPQLPDLAKLPAMLARASEIEVEISRRRNRLPKSMPAPPEVVLPEKTVLCDYYLYPAPDDAANERLACLVSRRGAQPRFVDLGDASELGGRIRVWKSGMHQGAWLDRGARRIVKAPPPTPRELAAQIRAAVWDPLARFVEPGDHVILSPEGLLEGLPWAALPGREPGTFLLEEHGLSLLPVPALLQPLRSHIGPAPKAEGLLVVGDVDFGPAAAEGKEAGYPALPGTAAEAKLIADLFRAGFPEQPLTHLARGHASKAGVSGAIAGRRYLHVATHGWFPQGPGSDEESQGTKQPQGSQVNPQENGMQPGASQPAAGNQANTRTGSGSLADARAFASQWNPTRTGLVFAGSGDKQASVLTAAEVTTLDLRGVQLAVLSACETGLGVAEGGEVVGLQRAFQVAGARSVVVSLWQVDDAATQALMVEFYRNLWERKLVPGEALRQAQLSMLRGKLADADAAGDRGHPFFWAGFVLSGQWK